MATRSGPPLPVPFTVHSFRHSLDGLLAAETGFPIQYSGVQPTATATNISTMINAYFGPDYNCDVYLHFDPLVFADKQGIV